MIQLPKAFNIQNSEKLTHSLKKIIVQGNKNCAPSISQTWIQTSPKEIC
jgi:hypothetical protein